LPIAAYGLIGDCRSAALVGADGSIDWLCLPRFDDESVFGRLLDARRGGYWQIAPTIPHRTHQRYRDRTNLLDTVFTTETGVVVVTDFMPTSERHQGQHGRTHDEARLVRFVECVAGEVEMGCEFDPRPDYGRSEAALSLEGNRIHADVESLHLCVMSTRDVSGTHELVQMRTGDAMAFGLRAASPRRCAASRWTLERARELLRQTQLFWWKWLSEMRYEGPYQLLVWRSAMTLKLLTYAPTGAILAAPTTSLPEWIGGDRNWDYRFTWLRDASLTLYAFFQLGMTSEAMAFYHWLTHRHLGQGKKHRIANLFDISGHAHTEETVLEHLEGYRKSRPVRVGNAAAHQLQLDVYGEVLDSAYVYARFGGEIDSGLWDELRTIVDLAIEHWELPDSSIWEVRSRREQYTYSKLMCWVAVDRGLRIAARYRLPHDEQRWKSARLAMHRRITTHGYSKKREAFVQILGGDALDAALLRISQVRFLPDRDPRIRSTVRAIAEHLGSGVLLRRYRTEESPDGLEGDEGAFLLCSFWLADALAHLGEVEEAQRIFERLITFASPLGLYSEEVNPRTGEFLGNYPQAFTHLALVGAAVNIERARKGQIAVRGLRRGQPTHG
jgi:GH15 family glucan-1,4-alpha-glucosidase